MAVGASHTDRLEDGSESNLATCSLVPISLNASLGRKFPLAWIPGGGTEAMEPFEHRGTGNASPINATEGILLLAAAVEAILVAGLALGISGVGAGSATAATFLRVNDLLLGPFAVLAGGGSGRSALIMQQGGAALGYGLVFLFIIGVVSWLDRRRLLY